MKLIGVYASLAAAEMAIARLRRQPGFRDTPDGFHIDKYQLDKDYWEQGFISVEEALAGDSDKAKATCTDQYASLGLQGSRAIDGLLRARIRDAATLGRALLALGAECAHGFRVLWDPSETLSPDALWAICDCCA